ncbi:WD40/YVTN/BNR-like repeat-containing protein [Marinobacterium sediminicola]|uniref:Photosynthesis system II assembly factor Ycf48/Hcf136-like domain-containing protein n=1 Tax=Marinobacterium sediminicola TaxID=518898 RepID=A0ABY1S2E4_9GAMM|nr:YCF48-related protein [Marinobacterium sediminicola]ULG70672.1 YCF48-related protein [Marinobacterium sediminicola]SMR77200.1 Uncharacterized protein SAMN04487964_11334 [Marinobacterium sediminicola]
MRKILLSSLVLASLLAPPGQPLLAAAPDRLSQPALHSINAARGLLLDLVKVPERERLLAVGEQGSILYSDDSGQSWHQAQSPVSVLLTAVQMVTAFRGWAIGHDGVILHTEDGGESWQIQAAGQQLLRQQEKALEQELAIKDRLAETEAVEEIQWQLDDLQVSLEEGAMPTLMDLLFVDSQRGFVIGAYGVIFGTIDGGESWHSLGHRLPNPDRMHLNAILMDSRNRLLVAGEAGLLMKSDDLGGSWQSVDTPYEGSFFALANHDQVFLLGLRGHLYRSSNGIDWQMEPVPTQASLNGAVSAKGELYLLGQGGVVLKRQGNRFVPVQPVPRYSFTSGVLLDDRLLLAGEGGIHRIDLTSVAEGAEQ